MLLQWSLRGVHDSRVLGHDMTKRPVGLVTERERNSWFLDDARSERADSSVNALASMCVVLADRASRGKQLWVCVLSILT